MISSLAKALILLLSFLAMEGIAWIVHRYVMHGFLWCLHRDHHQPPEGKALQKNDLFFLIFATPGILLIDIGASSHWVSWHGWAGIGISLYGLAYFLVHEAVIHRRFPLFGKPRNPYFAALRHAHGEHHKSRGRTPGVSYGMLLVPWRFFRDARGRGRASR